MVGGGITRVRRERRRLPGALQIGGREGNVLTNLISEEAGGLMGFSSIPILFIKMPLKPKARENGVKGGRRASETGHTT